MAYKILMADQNYTDNCQNYCSYQVGQIQYLINENDNEAPIYQVKLLIRKEACLINNWCNSESSMVLIQKVDPLFICIQLFADQFLINGRAVEYSHLFSEEMERHPPQFCTYLQRRTSLEKRMELIARKINMGENEYYQLDRNMLFAFLDIKMQRVLKHIKQDPTQTFITVSCNLLRIDELKMQNYQLIFQYLNKDLKDEYIQSRRLYSSFQEITIKQKAPLPLGMQIEQKQIVIEKKQKQSVKKQSVSEKQLEISSKGCAKIGQFFQIKKKIDNPDEQ